MVECFRHVLETAQCVPPTSAQRGCQVQHQSCAKQCRSLREAIRQTFFQPGSALVSVCATHPSACLAPSRGFLLRCNESRMVGLAVLFLLLGGHQLLQNANDLAALWCVPLTGIARQERKQRGTIIIGNPVRRAFEPTATSTESNLSGYLTKGSWLFSHHIDIQSTARKSHCHGYSRRLPALVALHFHIQSSAWTLGYLKRVVMDVYPRLFEIASL